MALPESAGRGLGVRSQGVSPPRFVGRERELDAVAAGLARPPAIVLLEGEAGIGKSRLVREFLDTEQGQQTRALVAICPPFRQPHTLGPLVDALRRAADSASDLGLSALGGAIRPLFPEWTDDLPPELEPAEDASAARHRVFRALAELVGCLGIGLLVVEDAHWADEATLDFLMYLVAENPVPLRLVVTYRAEDLPAGSLVRRLSSRALAGTAQVRLVLAPLDVADTERLVASMLAVEEVSGEFATFVHERTEGVPLAIEESVRVMSERADLTLRGGEWVRRPTARIDVPPTVRDAVLELTGSVDADARAVLRAAAVLAAPASEPLLAAVAGLSAGPARAGLTKVLAAGLLGEDEGGSVAFRHVLARQAVDEDIPGPERRVLHLRAGEELEGISPLPVARLARHFQEAGDTARWCRYGEQAADLAFATGDEATAGMFLLGLVTQAGLPPGEMARLTSKMVLLAFPADDHLRELVQALRAALVAGPLPRAEESELRFHLGRMLATIKENDASRAELQQALTGLDPGSLYAARAMMILGWPQDPLCPAATHLRWLSRAAQVISSLEPSERVRLEIDRVTALLMLGEESGWAAAAQLPSGEPAPLQRLQMVRAHLNIGEAAMSWGRYSEARQRLALAADLAQRHGYTRLHDACMVVEAYLDWLTGTWDGLAERVAAWATDEELFSSDRAQADLVAALLQAAQGSPAHAAEILRHVLEVALRSGMPDLAMAPAAALSRLHLSQRDVTGALQVSDEPTGIVERKQTWIWAADLAPARVGALTTAGRTDDAAELIATFARGVRGRDAPAAKAGLAMCRAIFAQACREYDRAADLFARSAAAWQVLPRPYEALLAREQQAGSLIAAGKPKAGLGLLAEVRQGLSDLGATLDADRTARVLRDHGVAVPRVWRGGRRGYGSRLSPRELEVAKLAAAGHTNREIAALLYRSPKTVEMQVYSAMRKLGVPTRAALIARAAQAGLTPDNG